MTSQNQNAISTFVFFDIETTGLPWQEKNRTKITELSFVAASRRDIENTIIGNIPPVSKLTFVLNPRRKIHPEVTRLTGLSNDLLRHAPVFSEKVKSITSFLQELPEPVCLVAHNGNIFDYKILLAECIDANFALPPNLLCVDSLPGFRKLLKGTQICHKTLTKENSSGFNYDSDSLLTDDEDWPDLNLSTEELEEIDELCVTFSDISYDSDVENDKTIKESKNVITNKKEAVKKLFENKSHGVVTFSDISYDSDVGNDKTIKESKNVITNKKEAVKKLFENKSHGVNKNSYALPILYERLLNKKEMNAHRAEADCLMLLQCVVALKQDFLPWADKACKYLTEIMPLRRY